MRKTWRHTITLAYATLIANLIGFTPVMAQDTRGVIKVDKAQSTLDENAAQNNAINNDAMAQVTSVSQLSDVQPTDWAFQALQSLVERYGAIAGYPDGTFRGNRALTRYEFAAGLNAALERLNELIAAGSANLIRKEDLVTLQRLEKEFARELATLRGRVDALEARTAELEASQFSTNTKLDAQVIWAVTDTFGDRVGRNSDESNTLAGYRIRLNFETNFTGKDLLRTRLEVGNFGLVTDVTSTNMTRLNFDANTQGQVIVPHLLYRFPINPLPLVSGYLSILKTIAVTTINM